MGDCVLCMQYDYMEEEDNVQCVCTSILCRVLGFDVHITLPKEHLTVFRDAIKQK